MSTRQLAAIMFTDMVGYTALMQQNETMAKQLRDRSKTIFDERLSKYSGKLLQNYGDGTLSIFSSALDAVKCAIEIQTLNLQSPKIEMRIGIHLGDVMFDDTGIYGDSVNVASRIESLATPGSIFISERLNEEIRNQNIEAMPLGFFELKNVRQPINVFAVSNPGIVVPSRNEVKGKVKQTLNSIAVLPFVHMSNLPDDEYFCDGISEEIINVLSRLEGLQVTSRTSSFAFKGKTEDVREIAAKLNVQKLLEGSVRKAGNKVRITAQLINAADGYHLWSETYDRSLEDIFVVQDDIAREIANKFRINLSENEHEKELVKAPTENLDAYKKYLEGIFLMNTQLPENIEPSIIAFQEAAQLDPAFVAPHCYLAFQYYFMGYSGIMPVQQAYQLSGESTKQAMRIDPEDSLALLADAITKIAYDFKWKEGKESLDKSLAKNPGNLLGLMFLCWYHFLVLEFDKVEEAAEKLLQFDPLGGFTGGAVIELLTSIGKFDRALEVADETLKFNPDNPYPQVMKFMTLGFMGNWQPALEFLEKMGHLYEEIPLSLCQLGVAYARSGHMNKAEEILNKLLKIEQENGTVLDQIALLYANLLNFEKLEERFRRSIENKSQGVLFWYKTPWLPDEINDYEGLHRIRREIGLPV